MYGGGRDGRGQKKKWTNRYNISSNVPRNEEKTKKNPQTHEYRTKIYNIYAFSPNSPKVFFLNGELFIIPSSEERPLGLGLDVTQPSFSSFHPVPAHPHLAPPFRRGSVMNVHYWPYCSSSFAERNPPQISLEICWPQVTSRFQRSASMVWCRCL